MGAFDFLFGMQAPGADTFASRFDALPPPPQMPMTPSLAGGTQPVPVPMPVPTPVPAVTPTAAPGAPMDIRSPQQIAGESGAATPGANPMDKLGEVLRGVKAPAAPETQRLGLPPNAPAPRAPTAIKGGDLVALMQMTGAGPGAQPGNDYKLPSTLGQALLGRR